MGKKVSLYIPKEQDLWFREKCMSDPLTMKYNAGYDVHFDGYHYDTGCIDFKKNKWSEWYSSKMNNKNFYYAYIKDEDSSEFVGYVNFNKDEKTNKATIGIVIKNEYQGRGYMRPSLELLIKEARKRGVICLTDTVPISRDRALKVFYDMGFKEVKRFEGKKFGIVEIISEIEYLLLEREGKL